MELLKEIFVPLLILAAVAAVLVFNYLRKRGIKPADMDDEIKKRVREALHGVGPSTPQRVQADTDELVRKLAAANGIIVKQRETIAALEAQIANLRALPIQPPAPPPAAPGFLTF